jgi:hypothetical protein
MPHFSISSSGESFTIRLPKDGIEVQDRDVSSRLMCDAQSDAPHVPPIYRMAGQPCKNRCKHLVGSRTDAVARR